MIVRRPPLHQHERSRPERPRHRLRGGEPDTRAASARRAPVSGRGAAVGGATAEGDRASPTALGAARGVKRFLMALALIGSVQMVIMLGVEAHRAVEGQRAIARLQSDIAVLEAEAGALAAVVEHADDHTYREQLARRRGFIYPDEIRVVPLR